MADDGVTIVQETVQCHATRAEALPCKVNQLPSSENCGLTSINFTAPTRRTHSSLFSPPPPFTHKFFADNVLFVTKM